MDYFSENTTSHFQTRLPHEWRLPGEWVVGLSEIQFPQTFTHIPSKGESNYIGMESFGVDKDGKQSYGEGKVAIKSGVYRNIEALLKEISDSSPFKGHLSFNLDVGGHVSVQKICEKKICSYDEHRFCFSSVLCKIMGFETSHLNYTVMPKHACRSQHPASLSNALPSAFFIYTDLCETHVTGDVQTPLLRVVPTNLDNYSYGSMRLQSFSAPKYVSLLKPNFETIEIDIRDDTGEHIPFDHGTLTVTLHFKRID